MANGSRDVELVIKAKDDTTKVVSSIVKALNDLTTGLADTGKAVEKGDTSFSKLGKSIGTLDKTLRGVSSVDRLAQQLDLATKAAASLESSATATAAEVDRLSTEMATAAGATAQFQEQLSKAETALEKERAALAVNQAAQKQLSAEYREAVSARSQLETAEKNLVATLETQQTSYQKAQDRLAKYSAELAQTDTPTKRLVNSFTAAQTAVDKTATAIQQSTNSLAQTRSSLETAGAAEATYAQRLDAGKTALDAQAVGIKTLNDAKAQAATLARDGATAEAALGRQYRDTNSALSSQQQGVLKANEALGTLRENVVQADAAFAQLAQAAQGPLTEAYRQQQSTVSQLNNAYQANVANLRELGTIMGAVGVPTKAMVENFDQLNAATREIQTAYKEQAAVLATLRTSLNESASDTTQLAAKQQLFAQSVTQGSAALAQVQKTVAATGAATERITTAQRQLGDAFKASGSGASSAADSTTKLSEANDKAAQSYVNAANASRQALDFTQRLRGEVLSLVSAYTGFYGIINLLGQTVDAYKTLEAAQSRLNALHGGNQQAVASDLDFVRRNADRLGIQFGVLSDSYTKFAASTANTVIQGQKTRDIFLAVAEAGRVNKLSLEDLNGIFVALTQIASKGRFQLEELSGQLGDRLPGALQILADGMGITVQQLLKLTKAGQVGAEHLTDFAGELNKRYGPALGAALQTTTTALGKLQNAAFDALVVFGKSGFIEGFTDLIRQLTTTLQSADFQSFAQRASAAFGELASVLGLAISNWKLLTVAASAFAGIKLVPVVLSLIKGFGSFATAIVTAGTNLRAGAQLVGEVSGVMGKAAAATNLFTDSILGLEASTGVGLALAAIGVVIGLWVTRTDEATAALDAHQRLVDSLKNSYDQTGQSVAQWSKLIKETSLLQAKTNLVAVQKAADDARQAGQVLGASFQLGHLSGDALQLAKQIQAIQKAWVDAGGDVNDYKAKINALGLQADDPHITAYANAILNAADAWQSKFGVALREAQLVIQATTGSAEEQKQALDELEHKQSDLAGSATDAGSAMDTFQAALDKLHKTVPPLTDDFKELQNVATIDKAYTDAVDTLTKKFKELTAAADFSNATNTAKQFFSILGQLLGITVKYGDALKDIGAQNTDKIFAGAKSGTQAAADLIRSREGFTPTATKDTDGRFRVGFGSDTVTDVNGQFKTVVEGMTTTIEDANRDLYRRLATYQQSIESTIGADRFNSFSDPQQAVLESIVHNYGTLPDRIVGVLKTGTAQDISTAILGLAGDNGGINRGRRIQEAGIFAAGDDVKRQNDQFDKQQDTDAKHAAATAQEITDNATKINQQQLINDGKGKEAAMDVAEAAARKKNADISTQDVATIRQQAGELFDLQQVKKDIKSDTQAAETAEQNVNALLEKRTALLAQYKAQVSTGDTTGAEATKTALETLNGQINTAITNAENMWKAIGGPAADVAVTKLETARIKATDLAGQAKVNQISWTKVGETFGNDLTDAFGNFAEAVANGTPIFEAARDALLKFASDFLIQIGKMIVEQAIFNAIRSLGGPFAAVGGAAGGGFAAGHTGGVVGSAAIGSGNMRRSVSPAVFANAPRFHDGGLPGSGLRPGEIPSLLLQGEEVLDKSDPRNILNGGAAANPSNGPAAGPSFKIVNSFDSVDVMSQALGTVPGEQAFINVVKRNRSTIRDIIQSG